MPWSNNGGGPKASGPWGGGGRGGGGGGGGPWGGGGGGGGRGPGSGGPGGQGPKIDDFFKKGQNQLKTVLGEGSGGGGFGILLALLVAAGAWIYASVYIVETQEQAVVLTFGEYTRTDGPGLGFAPWPVQRAEIRAVTTENVVEIGSRQSDAATGRRGRTDGTMLTGDENIIDINFQVAWNISNLRDFLFNLADHDATIAAVAESAMREVVGQSELAPLLNRDRALLAQQVGDLIRKTLDELGSGVNIIRVTLDRADPPGEVIDAFRDVQAAAQERDTLQNQAQAYFNERTAGARGEAARLIQEAEGYRARVVAEAEGEAARFLAVYNEYLLAQNVTRRRLYIETMERVFSGMNKIIIDEPNGGNGTGVVPYLPLDQLQRQRAAGN